MLNPEWVQLWSVFGSALLFSTLATGVANAPATGMAKRAMCYAFVYAPWLLIQGFVFQWGLELLLCLCCILAVHLATSEAPECKVCKQTIQ